MEKSKPQLVTGAGAYEQYIQCFSEATQLEASIQPLLLAPIFSRRRTSHQQHISRDTQT